MRMPDSNIRNFNQHYLAAFNAAQSQSDVADNDTFPEDSIALSKWIGDQEELLKRLQQLEYQFCLSHDPKYLSDFVFNGEYKKTEVREALNPPFALFNRSLFLSDGQKYGFSAEEMIEQDKRIAKELFPNIEIRMVTSSEGESLIAYMGIPTKTLHAALKLRHEQMSAANDLQAAKNLQGNQPFVLEIQNVPPGNNIPGPIRTPKSRAVIERS